MDKKLQFDLLQFLGTKTFINFKLKFNFKNVYKSCVTKKELKYNFHREKKKDLDELKKKCNFGILCANKMLSSGVLVYLKYINTF